MSQSKNRVVILLDPDGGFTVTTDDPCDVLAVADWVPGDRVYRLGSAHKVGRNIVDEILGTSSIGHSGDDRHAAVSNRVVAYMDGRSHLRLVDDEVEK